MPKDRLDRQSDLDYLGRLLNDFAARDGVSAEEAQRSIASRYRLLEREYIGIADAVHADHEQGEALDTLLLGWTTVVHRYMYGGLLRNAGEYRCDDEPNLGNVYFGGQRGQRRRMRYSGSPPSRIESDLHWAFRHLADKADPLRSSIAFYVDFNWVHPFYDANGRIGRLIVSIYLHLCGYYVNWDAIDERHGKFTRKMNNYHDRRTSKDTAQRERYFGFLLDFWKKYVDAIDTFYDPEVR